MYRRWASLAGYLRCLFFILVWIAPLDLAAAADKLVALYSSHAVPYSMPWVAEELGLFKKYDIDFDFVYIPSSSTATAAILGSNVEVGLLGGVGIVNAYASGASDLVFIGSIKNVMTQSILAKPEITKLEQLRGKRVGVTRIGSNTHFFSVQVFRRAGMNPDKDFTFIQTGGDNETLGALVVRSNRCGGDVAADRWPGDCAGFPLRRFRSRYRHSLRGVDDYNAPIGDREAGTGYWPLHARDGGGFTGDAPGQGDDVSRDGEKTSDQRPVRAGCQLLHRNESHGTALGAKGGGDSTHDR